MNASHGPRTATLLAALFAGTIASIFGSLTAFLASYELVPSWLGVSAPFLLFAWGAALGALGMRRALGSRSDRFVPLLLVFIGTSALAGILSFASAKHAFGLAQVVVAAIDLVALLGTLPFALAVGFTTRALSRALIRRLAADVQSGADPRTLASRATPWLCWAAGVKALLLPLELALPSTAFVLLAAVAVAAFARRFLALGAVATACFVLSFPTLSLMEKMAALPKEQARVSALAPCFDDWPPGTRGAYSLAAEQVEGVASAKTYFHSGYPDERVLKVTLTLGPTQRTKDDVLANVDAVLREVKCRRVDTEELSDHMDYTLLVAP